MNNTFTHLHLHTEYSIVDGIVNIDTLIETAAKLNMPAVAITDQMNLFALVKFYRAALKAGIKPIIGSDVLIHPEHNDKKPYRMVLLCQNQVGYRNLTRLLSRAYLEGQHTGTPLLQKLWFHGQSEGLIALSTRESDIGQHLLDANRAVVERLLQEWLTWFPDRFYLELVRSNRPDEENYIQAALELAEQFDVPVVASNDVRMLNADDFEAHEARVCIHEGWVLEDSKRPRLYSDHQHLRSPSEMMELFSDIPEAIENTRQIAQRCNLELQFGQVFLPNFPVPENMTLDAYFEQEASHGLIKRFEELNLNAEDTRQQYQQRLHDEIAIIKQMGFTGYFLIVADFVRWSKQNHIPVGPGRGSGAGSLVAYALNITDLDPIAHELLFERFLNPERVSMPDFDIDFCMEGRDRVIEYVAEKYGKDSVSQIITYGTMAARAVVRDVGRVLGYPYGFVDKLAKLIPFELGMTLEKALHDEAQLRQRYEQEEELRTLIDLAMKLEGVPRNVGKHAGGVVIAPSVLTDFTPLYCEQNGDNRVTQFDKDDIESIGLVKFDFLGLRTLTIIDWTVQAINHKLQQQQLPPIDINRLPLNDVKTYELLKSCATTAVFQLESRGMKDLVKRLQPDCFNDIVALVALFRPGPLQSGMVDDYINRKHGQARVEYPHPLLEPILRPTYGVILYQEQVMQIARELAGYTLGGADLLRRAMGKKKGEEMAKQRAIFVSGAQERKIDPHIANQIFDLMEKFADYGFNKSHSAAYALLAYQTAWLKAHYPAEFMAAVLSSDMDNTDKVVRFIEDAQHLCLKIVSPDINKSQYKFTVDQNGHIIYGLGAIKGVGAAAVEGIIAHREQHQQPFQNLFDFCQRAETPKLNRKTLEALIRSGAMDNFQVHRASLMASVDAALQAAEQHARNLNLGQHDLFGDSDMMPSKQAQYVQVEPWSDEEQLQGEKESLGWYLSGHPITRYQSELSHFISASVKEIKPRRDEVIRVGGYVSSVRTMQTKNGNRMAFLSLEDHTGKIDVIIFSDVYNNCSDLLQKDQLLIVEGEVGLDDFTGGNRLTAQRIYDLTHAREKFAKQIRIKLHREQVHHGLFNELQQVLAKFRGGRCPVVIDYWQHDAWARLTLGSEWIVKPSEELFHALHKLCGDEQVELNYSEVF